MSSLRWLILVALAIGFAEEYTQTSVAQNPATTEKPPLKAAILSGKRVEGEADLLAAALVRDIPKMAFLERTDLVAVTAEGALIAGKLPASLESADFLILVEVIDIYETPYLATRVVGRDEGCVHASDLRAMDRIGDDWTREITRILKDLARSKTAATNNDLPAVSVRVIRGEFTAGEKENELLSIAITRLLNIELSKGKQIRILERVDLLLVQFERFLTRIDGASFEEADQTISGTFRSSDGTTRFEIQMEIPGTSEVKKIEGTVPSENPGDIASAMATEVMTLLPGAGTQAIRTNPRPSSPNIFTPAESGRFAQEADRALRLGLHETAAKFAETAHLLDQSDGFSTLHLLSCAELFASIPSLRGRGIRLDNTILVERENESESEPLVFADLFPESGSEGVTSLPQRDQWPAISKAAERVVEMNHRALGLEGGRRNNAMATMSPFAGVVSQIAKEVLFNAVSSFGTEVPPYEKEHLDRLAAVSRALQLATAEAPNFNDPAPPLLFRGTEALILEASAEQALSRIRDWLYGTKVTSMKGEIAQGNHMVWYNVYSDRSVLFKYFEYLGYNEDIDDSTTLIDERIFKKPFVAWLSNDPMDYEEAFSRALAGAAAEHGVLTTIDAQFHRAGAARTHETRATEFEKLRAIIAENLATLESLGLLEIYAYHLANWEMSREPVTSSDREAFWKTVHAAVYADNAWSPGRLSERLIDYFDGAVWTSEGTEDSARRRELLKVLQTDIINNTNTASESKRSATLAKIENKLGELLEMDQAKTNLLLSDTRAVQGLAGIPEDETIVLKAASFGDYLPTLATKATEEGIFSFQHGNPERDAESHLLIFNLAGTVDRMPLPPQVYDLVNEAITVVTLGRLARSGDIRVDKERIDLAFPGGFASYDRASQQWTVTPVPFLKGRHGVRMTGDKILSFTGRVENLPEVPVHGIYLTDTTTMEHLALVDTSRQPPLWTMDMSKSLEFTIPPLSFTGDRLIFGMRGIVRGHEIFYFKTDWKMDDPRRRPHPLPFVPGPGARVHGSEANGYALVAATRKPYRKTGSLIENESRMQVGAFAIDETGKNHWLLDSGTVPAIGPIPPGAGTESDRKMFLYPDKMEPIFTFPDEFSTHSGPNCSEPILHYNGTRLLLLTGQVTNDGRRLLYVWKNHEEKIPRRFALRFQSFFWLENLNEEDIFNWNVDARNTILSIFEWRDHIVFEYPRGFLRMSIAEFEKYIGE